MPVEVWYELLDARSNPLKGSNVQVHKFRGKTARVLDLRDEVSKKLTNDKIADIDSSFLRIYECGSDVQHSLSTSLGRLSTDDSPLAVVVPLMDVWFELVDGEGHSLAGIGARFIPQVREGTEVHQLQEKIVVMFPSRLAALKADQLTIYENQLAYDSGVGLLQVLISDHGSSDNPLIVEVPIRQPVVSRPVAWKVAETPCPALAFDDELITIPSLYLRGSGFGHANGLVLYRRPQLIDEWQKLQRYVVEAHGLLWISGPPGAGKSCAAFAFACSLDRETGWDVVWINCSKHQRIVSCILFSGTQKRTCTIKTLEVLSLMDSLTKETVVFLDGYARGANDEVYDACRTWREGDAVHHRLVCVCSVVPRGNDGYGDCHEPLVQSEEGILLKSLVQLPPAEQAIEIRVYNENVFQLLPWTLKDYRSALNNEMFFEHVKTRFTDSTELVSEEERNELLEAKVFVTGGNARLMFDFSTTEARRVLLSALDNTRDLESYVLGEDEAPPQKIDRWLLSSCFKPGSTTPTACLVSKFVAREFACRLGPEYLLDIGSLSDGYFLDDYFSELWFFAKLTHGGVAYSAMVNGRECNIARWTLSAMEYIDPVGTIPLNASMLWLAPAKLDLDGYDAVFIDTDHGLVRFIQVTHGTEYSFKERFFTSLLNRLPSERPWIRMVEVYFVAPSHLLRSICAPVDENELATRVLEPVFGARGHTPSCLVKCVGVDYAVFRQDKRCKI